MVLLIASCKNGAHFTMSTVPIGFNPKSISGGAMNDMPSFSMQGIGSLGFRWKYTRTCGMVLNGMINPFTKNTKYTPQPIHTSMY